MKKLITLIIAGLFLSHTSSVLAQGIVSETATVPDGTEIVSTDVEVTPTFYDFGDIYQSKGEVSTEITVKNTGEQVLEINRLSTSCGCTTAEMDLSDMSPGESRKMVVAFDPMVHPDQTGPIVRTVYLQTSDPTMPEVEIEFTGIVLGEGESPSGESFSDEIENVSEIGVGKQAVVFFNEACQGCGELVNEKYPDFFAEYGIDVVKRDYINERENRQLLNEYNAKWKVPFELQSHIETFVGENLLIGGHVPENITRYLLENPNEYEKLLVYQDKMHGEEEDYKVWDFRGEIKTYPIDEPITTYLDWLRDNQGDVGDKVFDIGFWGLFAVVTSSAFLDGINPCALAVLLFFVAFLFSIKRTRKSIWKMGLVYVSAIYLAYLLIGLGLAQAIIISGSPHLMAYIGAYLVIGLGIIQLLGVAFPKFPIKLRIPMNTKATVEKWLFKATLPAAFIGGFIVGLCTFPCSGGIYVAIIGMLTASQTYIQGLGWMLWYNLVFVAPLLILLVLAANPKTTEKLQKWERKESKHEKLIIGITMVVLGVIILLFIM